MPSPCRCGAQLSLRREPDVPDDLLCSLSQRTSGGLNSQLREPREIHRHRFGEKQTRPDLRLPVSIFGGRSACQKLGAVWDDDRGPVRYCLRSMALVVKIKRKSPTPRESFQSLARQSKGSKRLILSTRAGSRSPLPRESRREELRHDRRCGWAG
jgi:hypothetical protein